MRSTFAYDNGPQGRSMYLMRGLIYALMAACWSAVASTPGGAITITMEYTDEGDPEPHDENPAWDRGGLNLKRHFERAKQIWESLLPGPGSYEFDFHWDDDIGPALGKTTDLGALDVFIEINPNADWYSDPDLQDDADFSLPATQKLVSDLGAATETFLPGALPPSTLETGYWRTGDASLAGRIDLLTVILHEMGHVLGIGADPLGEPGEFNIDPQHVGGVEDVLVRHVGGGHLAGTGDVPGYLMVPASTRGRRIFPSATDVLVIAEDQGISDVHLARVGSIASGLWSDPTRWLGDSAPDSTQSAYISHGGAVTLDTSRVTPSLRVNNGSSVLVNNRRLDVVGEFDMDGGNASVDAGGTIAASKMNRGVGVLSTAAGSLVQFNQFETPPAATVIFNGSVEIGYGGASAQVPVAIPAANSTWTIAEQLSVGIGGRTAELQIGSGADVTSASGRLGMNTVTLSSSGGSVRVDGNGSTWNVGPLQVRNGELTAINSGRVNSGTTGLGREGGLGRATVDNSRWDVEGDLNVGAATIFSDASGTVAIRNDGNINVDGNVDVRGTPSRMSEISVRSTGSLNVDGEVVAGPYGALSYYNNVVANGPFVGATTFKALGAAADSGAGGVIRFYDDASAGNGHFTNEAPTTLFGSGGSTEFRGSASAGTGDFHNLPGGSTSVYSGTTRFFDFATAADGKFYNQPGRWTTPPTVEFNGDSSGGDGDFFNLPGVLGVSLGGAFIFNDRAKAGTGTYANQGEGGSVTFNDFSTAEDGTFTTADTIGSGNSRITFNEDSRAGIATFIMGAGSVLNFITRSSAEDATIVLRQGSVASFGGDSNVPRLPTVTAGTADFAVQGSSVAGAYGGHAGFSTYSTAGDAVIDTYGGTVTGAFGGTTRFDYEGRAGNATLITHGPGVAGAGGGVTEFARGANGDTARAITHAGGWLSIAGNRFSPVTTFGSIEGAGTYELSGAELQTGSRNTSTTVSGAIIDAPASSLGGRLIKVGTGTLTLAGANTYTGLTTVNNGAVNVTGSLAGGALVNSGGTLAGTGSIAGAVTVNAGGMLAPGASPDTLWVGSLTLGNGSVSQFELGAPASDRLTAGGNIVLGGTLSLSLFGGFTPAPGQVFTLFDSSSGSISGAFDAINTPSGFDFDVVQNPGSLLLRFAGATLTADFDEDGDVDGNDLIRWRAGYHSGTTHGQGNADGDGDVDGADFLTWQRQVGVAGAASSSATAAVPEPASGWLGLIAALGLSRLHYRRSSFTWNRNARLAAVALVLASLALPRTAQSAAFFWNGQGGTPHWSNGANWNGGTSPANDGSSDLFFGAVVGPSVTIANIPGITQYGAGGGVVTGGEIRGMTFMPAAGAYTVDAVDPPTGFNGIIFRSGGIANLSPSLQTFDTRIFHDDRFPSQLDGGAAGLLFRQGLGQLGGGTSGMESISGSGPITFEKYSTFNSGAGVPPIVKSGSGTITFQQGVDSYLNSFVINGGAAQITGNHPSGTGSYFGSVAVNGNSSLHVFGGAKLDLATKDVGLQVNSGVANFTGPGTTLKAVRSPLADPPAPFIASSVGNGGASTLNFNTQARGSFDSLTVGVANPGSLTVQGGSQIDNGVAIIGKSAGVSGTALVNGGGSSWTNSGDILVGEFGAGSLEIRGGAALTNFRAHLGFQGGSSGALLVRDAGSTWTAGGSMFIGNGGYGAVQVENGATASTAGNAYLGFSTFSTGEAAVRGGGSTWSIANTLYVGGNADTAGGPFASTLRIENGGRVNAGSTTLYNTGIVELTNDATFNSPLVSRGGLVRTFGSPTYNGNVSLETGGLFVTAGTAVAMTTFSGALTGPGGLTKSGVGPTGALRLTGASTYDGATTINSGSLLVDGSLTSFATVNTGGTLGGSGVVGLVDLRSGGTIAPGSSAGLLTTAGATIHGGANYTLELASDGSGVAGTHWDSLAVAGMLDISGLTAENPLNIRLRTLSEGGAPSPLAGWNRSVDHTWSNVLTTSGVTGTYDASLFRVDTTGFANPRSGAFSVVQNGDNFDLVYDAAEIPDGVLVSNLAEPVRFATPMGNNPNPVDPPGLPGTPWYWAAQKFHNDELSRQLASIVAKVGNGSAEPLPVVVAELHADDAGAIGPLLTTLTAPDMAGAISDREFFPTIAVELDPHGAYWLLLGSETPGDGTFQWSYANTNDMIGTGTLGNYADSADSGETWIYRSTDFPYQMQVNTGLSAALADFNGDGAVDGGDLEQWRENFGAGVLGDADADGDADGADFLAWQRQLNVGPSLATVPEANSETLIWAGIAASVTGTMVRGHRGRSRICARRWS